MARERWLNGFRIALFRQAACKSGLRLAVDGATCGRQQRITDSRLKAGSDGAGYGRPAVRGFLPARMADRSWPPSTIRSDV